MDKPILGGGKNDPAATDLDYYSKPENYTGSNLQSLQKFKAAKEKEEKVKDEGDRKKVVKDEKYFFFRRYKHLLRYAIFRGDLLQEEEEPESSEEEEEEEDEQDRKAQLTSRASTRDGRITVTPIIEDALLAKKAETLSMTPKSRITPQKSGMLIEQSSQQRMDELSSPESGTVSPSKRKSRVSTVSASPRLSSVAINRARMDAKALRSIMVREKFIKLVNIVKAICRLNASARGSSKSGKGSATGGASLGQTFMEMASDDTNTEENMKNLGLSFDPTFFKAKREISLSNETKQILSTMSHLRTPEQVQTAMFGLQSLRSYAEYPLHMQEKLAKVAWYEKVAPKRIIIRQGHVAENFYFVLSGNAVVTILIRDPVTGASTVKTATVMKKGMSFGELALLHHSKRTATVTSQDMVQLLSIGRDDFFDIFMSSSGPDNMPDHVRYISNLDFMKDWPIEQLLEHPEHCLLHFFKRNNVIVNDSNKSDWLYIVKSGSCQVLKKLKGVKASTNRCVRRQKFNDDYSKTDAFVFEPKVDTGLRRKNEHKITSQTEKKSEQKNEESDESEESSEEGIESKFSKENYSNKPDTKPAHFSAQSSFAKRKKYEPPEKSKPKKPQPQPKENDTSVKPPPVFVQVQNLNPRDVFGLDTVRFDDDIERQHTSVSLISRGAECVMLTKEFYAKYANEIVKKRVRQYVRQYPDEDVFQENLQIKEDWEMYKKVLLNDITTRMRQPAYRY